MNPQFLPLDEVMDSHRDQIERYGGTLGVRDAALRSQRLRRLNWVWRSVSSRRSL